MANSFARSDVSPVTEGTDAGRTIWPWGAVWSALRARRALSPRRGQASSYSTNGTGSSSRPCRIRAFEPNPTPRVGFRNFVPPRSRDCQGIFLGVSPPGRTMERSLPPAVLPGLPCLCHGYDPAEREPSCSWRRQRSPAALSAPRGLCADRRLPFRRPRPQIGVDRLVLHAPVRFGKLLRPAARLGSGRVLLHRTDRWRGDVIPALPRGDAGPGDHVPLRRRRGATARLLHDAAGWGA